MERFGLPQTRIMLQKSDYMEYFFPQRLVEKKNWWGKITKEWEHLYGDYYTKSMVEGRFGGVSRTTPIPKDHTEAWAKLVIDLFLKTQVSLSEREMHHKTKEITFIDYP